MKALPQTPPTGSTIPLSSSPTSPPLPPVPTVSKPVTSTRKFGGINRAPIAQLGEIIKEGMLTKKIDGQNTWKERWVRCTKSTLLFATPDKSPIGSVELRGCTIEISIIKLYCFTLVSGKSSYIFVVSDQTEYQDWMTTLKNVIKELDMGFDTMPKEEREKQRQAEHTRNVSMEAEDQDEPKKDPPAHIKEDLPPPLATKSPIKPFTSGSRSTLMPDERPSRFKERSITTSIPVLIKQNSKESLVSNHNPAPIIPPRMNEISPALSQVPPQDQLSQLVSAVAELSKKLDQECQARQTLENTVKKLEKQLEEERQARMALQKSINLKHPIN